MSNPAWSPGCCTAVPRACSCLLVTQLRRAVLLVLQTQVSTGKQYRCTSIPMAHHDASFAQVATCASHSRAVASSALRPTHHQRLGAPMVCPGWKCVAWKRSRPPTAPGSPLTRLQRAGARWQLLPAVGTGGSCQCGGGARGLACGPGSAQESRITREPVCKCGGSAREGGEVGNYEPAAGRSAARGHRPGGCLGACFAD